MYRDEVGPDEQLHGPVSGLKFIDLFAGLGGFHVALSGLGASCVYACEWDETLQGLYKKNFSLEPVGDITKVDLQDVPEHDLLCAGFPCQPFSKAGEQLGFDDTEQGELFYDVLKILRIRKPRFFVLENVPNLLKHNDGETIREIESKLDAAGYSVNYTRFSPHQFGIPQIRDRLYIVGALKSIADLDDFEWPAASDLPTSINTVLDDNPADARQLSDRVEKTLSTWNRFIQLFPEDKEIPSFPIWSMEFGATYPYLDSTPDEILKNRGAEGMWDFKGSFGISLNGMSTEEIRQHLPSHALRGDSRFPKWKTKFISQNREFWEIHRAWLTDWLPAVKGYTSSFQKFEWNAKGEERDIWKFVIQLRASGVRVKRPTTAPSLIAMTDTQVPIIGWERRYMTPHECAQLQSLGAIELPASSTRAFRALGNAVNAKVVERIVSELVSFVDTNSSRKLAAVVT